MGVSFQITYNSHMKPPKIVATKTKKIYDNLAFNISLLKKKFISTITLLCNRIV